jgi:hypothetical protein
MRRALARMDRRGVTVFWWENVRVGNHLEDLDVSRRIILKWTVNKLDGEARTGLIWRAGFLE